MFKILTVILGMQRQIDEYERILFELLLLTKDPNRVCAEFDDKNKLASSVRTAIIRLHNKTKS